MLQKDEVKQVHLEDFSTASTSFHLEVVLVGNNAVIEVIGRAQSLGKSHKKWVISLTFNGENQKGILNLRGTAEDESLLEFDGAAILSKGSMEAEVEIVEKIVLFDSAKGRCLPILTVKTDKVKSASHAASIAPFEDEQVLFCESRGLGRKASEDLLKEGFLAIN